MQQVAMARINTLLRRWPDAPLPSPPPSLEPPQQPADAGLLWQTALQQRPDLAALAWRVQAAEAALALAYKQYYPDFDVFGRYDTFWQPSSTQGPLRGQVGVAVNLPVYRREAAGCGLRGTVSSQPAAGRVRSAVARHSVRGHLGLSAGRGEPQGRGAVFAAACAGGRAECGRGPLEL